MSDLTRLRDVFNAEGSRFDEHKVPERYRGQAGVPVAAVVELSVPPHGEGATRLELYFDIAERLVGGLVISE